MANLRISESLKGVHWIKTTEEHESRRGEVLATRNHDVIRQWARARDAAPVVIIGTEHGELPGALAFSFPDVGGADLKQVSWDEWFKMFDDRGFSFVYQETTEDGLASDFFEFATGQPDRG